jgi:hypothetical protein
MKKLSLVSLVILVSFCVYGKFTYDPSEGTIVDEVNGWKLKVACKNTDELTLLSNGSSFSGTAECPLDLTEIYSADGTTRYRAVDIRPIPAAAKPYITAFIAPELTDISEGAFMGCSKLSTVSTPKVLRIGNQAFQSCTALSTESVNGLLHSAVERLGSNDIANQKSLFAFCTAIKGPISWNLPSLTTNVVADSMFFGCSALEEVRIMSDVAEIKSAAFKNIAPGASVYMPLAAPAVFGGNAVCRESAPYPKIYLKGNYDAWFKVIGVSHQILPKERFNDPTWTPTTTQTSYAMMRQRMSYDTEMCTTTKTGSTITEVAAKDKNVIAFVAFNNASFCWVLKMPEQGFRVIVR